MSKLLTNDQNKVLVGSNGKAYAVGNMDALIGTSSPASFTASANRVLKLLRYGKCEQSGTPTPSVPVPIVCNNGALALVDDELPTGYRRLDGIQLQDARIVVPFYITGEDTLRFRARGAAGNWIGSFNDASANDNVSFYASTNSGAKYSRYNGQTGGSAIYTNTWYDIEMSPTGVSGPRNASSFTPATFTCSEPLNIGATSREGTPGPNVSFEGNIVVDGRLKLIPCERESDNALGYHDGTTFYTSEIGTMTSLGYDTSHITKLAVVGTAEAITLGAQSASVEDLLQVGDYIDEQDIISGKVTRRCGACVYDGTQTIGDVFLSTTGGKDSGAIIVYPLATPTTEQVTPQPLNTSAGTNTLTDTANVSNPKYNLIYKI